MHRSYLNNYLISLYRTSFTLEVTKKKKKQKEYFDEVYTDKDRAAAVSMGIYYSYAQSKIFFFINGYVFRQLRH